MAKDSWGETLSCGAFAKYPMVLVEYRHESSRSFDCTDERSRVLARSGLSFVFRWYMLVWLPGAITAYTAYPASLCGFCCVSLSLRSLNQPRSI